MKKRKNNKIFAFIRAILLIAVCLVLGINLYRWNSRSLTGNMLPMTFGYGAAVVLSGSMEPTIMTDDLIFVEAQESYEVGDIVVYQSGKMLIVHRIVAMDEESVVTRGDANNVDDEPVPPSFIKGEVIGWVSGLGTVVRIIKTPVVSLMLIICALLLVELPYIRKKKKDTDELEKIKAEIRRLKAEQEN